MDIGLQEIINSVDRVDLHAFVDDIVQKQKSIFEIADERIKRSQEIQKEQYKKRKGLANCNFKEGSIVLRRNMKQKTRKGSKNEDRWLGPYTIVDLIKTSCRLKTVSGKYLKTRTNINQLKLYCQDSTSGII